MNYIIRWFRRTHLNKYSSYVASSHDKYDYYGQLVRTVSR